MAEHKHKQEKIETLVVEQSPAAQREAETLKFWREHEIFEKTLEKDSPKGEFVFYDGPPFATGSPHYGHILAGTMKDVIPRFRTMQGYHVPRRWGWDTHGLPIENLIEKELGLKSKKDIEELGVEKFNAAARDAVLRYDHEWKDIIPRTGRFIDMDNAYLTMQPSYSESIWWSFKTLHDKGLIYNGFKSMMYCPHCGTTLSNFEVAQGYKDITDISVFVKFELVDEPGTFVLAWTTTPWTLPGNVALAVGADVEYVKVKIEDAFYILAKERLEVLKDKKYEVVEEMKGKDLVGKKYTPVFDYYVDDKKIKNHEHGWKIVAADFVTTTDGTGVVHIAPAFGEDDYNLSLKEKLPFIQHVGLDGAFKKEVTDFAGQQVKPKSTSEDPVAHQKADVEVIKYLAKQGSLFDKLKIVHSYPHCWRCDTPLLNYATSSWFVEVTKFKDKLVAENNKVNWIPPEIGEGRFGKWLENARDWAISRSRYWGAPLPVWICKECNKTEVLGSIDDIRMRTKRNTYFVVRHGQADHNVQNILSSDPTNPHHLTDLGREEVSLSVQALKDKKIDLIVTSPMVRTKETVDVIVEQLAYKGDIQTDARLTEFDFGDFNLESFEKYHQYYSSVGERLTKRLPHGENINDIRQRVGAFLYDIDSQYENKTIVIVTHDSPASILFNIAEGADDKRIIESWALDKAFIGLGQEMKLDFAQIPHNDMYELDLHRPYIDNVTFTCECGGEQKRVPEVFDTWYESGSMPFASLHYPFENKELIDTGKRFPANFIAEGVDQTRGWFYSTLVLSTALFGKSPYQNVIVNGTILAEDGQKMSKKLKNYPDVNYILNRFGADAMRYYLMASPVVHAEDLSFSEKGVDEINKKIIQRLMNVFTFFETYSHEEKAPFGLKPENVLDQWILARLAEITKEMTESLEKYELDKAAKPLMGFVDDLSTWYVRRSRDRFKGDDEKDKQQALHTTRHVLFELSKIMAPFMPFMAEDLYQKLKGPEHKESVHLEIWPDFAEASSGKPTSSQNVLENMEETRAVVTLALEARSSAGIKVRQPLQSLALNKEKYSGLGKMYLDIIKDELNVKEVHLTKDLVETELVKLDTTISAELKLEGQAREFIRAVQDLRKKSNFNPTDVVTLTVSTNDAGKHMIETFTKEISKTAQLSAIHFAENEGEKITIDDLSFTITTLK